MKNVLIKSAIFDNPATDPATELFIGDPLSSRILWGRWTPRGVEFPDRARDTARLPPVSSK